MHYRLLNTNNAALDADVNLKTPKDYRMQMVFAKVFCTVFLPPLCFGDCFTATITLQSRRLG
ncbi:hypothetical protein CEP80_04840 [Jonesia denitrificans]|nr:hypothetical protein CEP80_04840 [Jonesia denitrificans]